MHEQFLERLMGAGDVYLLARLKDDRLRYAHPHDMRIFIPDLHLIGSDREALYKYTTNYPDLLKRVMREVKAFKTDPANGDKTIAVYQLGDFLDLWRQVPAYWSITDFTGKWEAGVQQILDDRADIINLFRDPAVKTNFLLGNHDFDLHNLAGFVDWNLKYYFPIDPLDGPSVITLHGDLFSLFERKVPDSLQYLAVYLLGPLNKAKKRYLGEIRKKTIRVDIGRNFSQYIRQRTPPVLDRLLKIPDGRPALEDVLQNENFNVKDAGHTDEKNLKFLEEARNLSGEINEDMEWNLSTAVVGHTHHARIATDQRNGKFFALVDCGAWIEKSTAVMDGEETVIENAQIGVLHNNDVRIYQLQPKI